MNPTRQTPDCPRLTACRPTFRYPLPRTRRAYSAFTLVELLVVVAVLTVVAAMLLPALGKARQKARNSQCLNNLSQLTIAWKMYPDDNNGKLVPNGDEYNQPASLTDPAGLPGGRLAQWCPGRQDQQAMLSPDPVNGMNIGEAWIKMGILYPYVNTTVVYKCPADQSSISFFGQTYPHVRSISMNTWLGDIAPYAQTTSVASYYKKSALSDSGAANLWVFIDENPTSINDGSFICSPTINQWVDCPATYHNKAGGLSYADGHAQIKRWQDPTVLKVWAPPTIQPGNPGCTRLPPGTPSDLSFLQSISTVIK